MGTTASPRQGKEPVCGFPFVAFMAKLPPELSFLRHWRFQDVKTMESRAFQAGRNPNWIHTKHDQYTFFSTAPAQKIARELKLRLTVKKGWKLSFPNVGDYSARAVRRGHHGFDDWTIHFMAFSGRKGRSFMLVHDQSKPSFKRTSNTADPPQ
jgi:hypothetical protein